jgi:hypothetical protein
MAETYTTNKSFAQVTPGTDSGTWGPFVNNNVGILDTMLGGTATIPLTNANVQLSSGQYQCLNIVLTGTLSGNVQITLPGGVGGFWNFLHSATNNANFFVTLNSTVPASPVIGLPPGQVTPVIMGGGGPIFANLPHHIGGYWFHGGSSIPAWVSNCTFAPYLNCDGTTFSSASFPALAGFLGGNTLPDARGRALFATEQGTGRLAGAAFLGGYGNVNTTITQANLPNVNLNPNFSPVNIDQGNIVQTTGGLANSPAGGSQFLFATAPNFITPTVTLPTYSLGGSGTPATTAPPLLVHGLTLIRAG